jgi:hypothetical protein
MTDNNLFGTTQSEKKLGKITICRDIVREIVQFGVSNQQILLIIQLLAYELENIEQMREIVAITKEFMALTRDGGELSLLEDAQPELLGVK